MTVSVLHRELEYKVENPRIINKSELPVGEWAILDRPHKVLQLWLINAVYQLLISEEYKGEENVFEGVGLKEDLWYLHLMFISWMCFHYVISVWDREHI